VGQVGLLGFGKQNRTQMTHPAQDHTLLDQLVNHILEDGTDGLAGALRLLLNHAMEIERSQALGAGPYERTSTRTGHANGFKPKTLQTRLGEMTVAVPQVRGGVEFYPSALDRGRRSERALVLAIAQMYVEGVSTRKVSSILQQLAGTLEISSTQVSRASAQLDGQLEGWRNRRLDAVAYPYLILDARYEKVRRDGVVLDCAVLLAIGIDAHGRRTVLGVSTALSEAEVHWRDFLSTLQDRGLHGTTFIVSDDHKGLRAALQARLAGVPWQRCQFHLQQNALHYVPRTALRASVAAQLREVLYAPTRPQAETLLKTMAAQCRTSAPELAAWLEANVPESLTVLTLPPEHRVRLRTSNAAERLNQEIKRRTRVARVFPNPASLLRLVSAVLNEISDDWESAKTYLNMNPPSHHQAA
jgi:transposase-like protein